MGYFTGHEEDRDRARGRGFVCDVEKRCGLCVACWAFGWIAIGLLWGCLFWAGFVSWAYIFEGRDVALALAYGDDVGFGLTILCGTIWLWFPRTQGRSLTSRGL